MARAVDRNFLLTALVLGLVGSAHAYNATGSENATLSVWNPASNSYQPVSFMLNAGVIEGVQMNGSSYDNGDIYVTTEAIWLTDSQGEQEIDLSIYRKGGGRPLTSCRKPGLHRAVHSLRARLPRWHRQQLAHRADAWRHGHLRDGLSVSLHRRSQSSDRQCRTGPGQQQRDQRDGRADLRRAQRGDRDPALVLAGRERSEQVYIAG